MFKFILAIITIFLITGCSFKKVNKQHGVPFLEEKQKLLVVNNSNKNDIKKTLGSPSSISNFNNDVWIYIERQMTQSEFKNFGRMQIVKNDILVLEIDSYGVLRKKEFYNKDDLSEIEFTKDTTKTEITKKSFLYDFMASMRQKLNDPLGTRAKKRRKLNQR